VFLGERNQGRIEYNDRIFKFNYRSQKGYSIDEIILEKRLIYNISMREGSPTLYIIIDLELYYDKQLSNIASIVEESVWFDHNRVKLIAKVLPVF